MNKYLANARFFFLYVAISAVVVGIVMTYSLVTDLPRFQTALALTGGLLGAWATLFTLLEIRRIARKARGQAEPVSIKTGFWVLLPLAGGIIWFLKTNGALNDYWQSLGATA